MSSFCKTCHSNPCGCSSPGTPVHGHSGHYPAQPYHVPAGYPAPGTYPPHGGYTAAPQHPSTVACPPQDCPPNGALCATGEAQALDEGDFQATDGCGKPVPFARVSVTFAHTQARVPLFYRPTADPQFARSNPVTTDESGHAPIYFYSQGYDIVVKIERVCGDGSTELVRSFIKYAKLFENNTDLTTLSGDNCIEITNPLTMIYDGDNCNRPHQLIPMRYALIQANLAAGLPAGRYSDVRAYFECLGTPWLCDALVYDDNPVCPVLYRYACDDCDQEVPPNPTTVEFDDQGVSLCWVRKGWPTVSDLVSDICATPEAVEALGDCIGGAGGLSNSRVFNSDGNFTVPADVSALSVYVIGGGGGSGGRGSVNSSTGMIGGGGGGSGGYGQSLITGLTPGTVIGVTVGQGGAGAQYLPAADSVGGNGGSSSFGTLLVAQGGRGGTNQVPGQSGDVTGGQVVVGTGAATHATFRGGSNELWNGGAGGGGTNAPGAGFTTDGIAGRVPGAGGSGASRADDTLPAQGGAGANGRVIVYW